MQRLKTKSYRGKAVEGSGMGKKLGYPTINIDNVQLFEGKKRGVYLCRVEIKDKLYNGLLYFGPKLIQGEEKDSLEIYVFDFDKNVYGEMVEFSPLEFIRKPLDFESSKSYKRQLEKDIAKAKKLFNRKLADRLLHSKG